MGREGKGGEVMGRKGKGMGWKERDGREGRKGRILCLIGAILSLGYVSMVQTMVIFSFVILVHCFA